MSKLKPTRKTPLPDGWKWHNNMAVTDGRTIVYLTNGLRDPDDIGRHIHSVMEGRRAAAARQAMLDKAVV